MSNALTPSDFMGVTHIYLPIQNEAFIDRLYCRSTPDQMYTLTTFIGFDAETNTEIFVIEREETKDSLLPLDGCWEDVNVDRTILRSVYKNLSGDFYRGMQEFYDVIYDCADNRYRISRATDDFGIEKLRLSLINK